MTDIDVLHVVVVYRVSGKELSTAIVDKERSGLGDVLPEVTHETMKPDGFLRGFSGCDVFGFGG